MSGRLNLCSGVNEWEVGERRLISPSLCSWGQGFGFDLMLVLLVVGEVGSIPCLPIPEQCGNVFEHRHPISGTAKCSRIEGSAQGGCTEQVHLQ